MSAKIERWIKASVGLALTFGVLDPVFKGISDFAANFRARLMRGIEQSKLIYEWQRKTNNAPEETFGEFFTGYINGILADAIDQNHMNMPVVASALSQLLGSMVGTDGRFWAQSLKDPRGFLSGAIGQKVGVTGLTVWEQVGPVAEHILMRIQNDYAQAVQWKETSRSTG